jgi:hypothetical protein
LRRSSEIELVRRALLVTFCWHKEGLVRGACKRGKQNKLRPAAHGFSVGGETDASYVTFGGNSLSRNTASRSNVQLHNLLLLWYISLLALMNTRLVILVY